MFNEPALESSAVKFLGSWISKISAASYVMGNVHYEDKARCGHCSVYYAIDALFVLYTAIQAHKL